MIIHAHAVPDPRAMTASQTQNKKIKSSVVISSFNTDSKSNFGNKDVKRGCGGEREVETRERGRRKERTGQTAQYTSYTRDSASTAVVFSPMSFRVSSHEQTATRKMVGASTHHAINAECLPVQAALTREIFDDLDFFLKCRNPE